jgi:hypothetical protein
MSRRPDKWGEHLIERRDGQEVTLWHDLHVGVLRGLLLAVSVALMLTLAGRVLDHTALAVLVALPVAVLLLASGLLVPLMS